jgi:CRISPR/Cas system endoribonuclease Cas6 (RAMP superfamily)
MALATVLLLSWAWKAHERNGMQRFIVYDQRDGLTCAVENGRLLTVFADTLDAWTRRKIPQHDRSIGALAVDTVLSLPETVDLVGWSADSRGWTVSVRTRRTLSS